MYLPHPYVKVRPDPKVWGVKKFTDRYIKYMRKRSQGRVLKKEKKRKKRKKEEKEKEKAKNSRNKKKEAVL